MQELRIQIGAETDKLEQGLRKAEGSLNKFEKAANKGGQGLNKFGKGAANAVPATQEFSRVIQDAPFGIQGVANNITQLTTQFGNLSAKTGGTSAALKAMLGTLSGPAGILLIISAVTSAMVAFGDKLKFATSLTDDLAKATGDLVAKVQTEISTLNTLIKVARDENNSKSVRLGAIKSINDKYSKYLGNLDLESIKTDKVTRSVNALSLALIQKAKIQGVEDLITEKNKDNAEDLIKADLDRQKALGQLTKQLDDAISGNRLLNDALGDIKGTRERYKAFVQLAKQQSVSGEAARQSAAGIIVASNAYKEASANVNELTEKSDEAIMPLVRLSEAYKKTLFGLESDIAKSGFDQKEIVINADKDQSSKNLKRDINSILSAQAFDISIKAELEQVKKIGGSLGIGENFGDVTASIPPILASLQGGYEMISAETIKLNENLGETIRNGAVNAFASIGESIGNALTSGASIVDAVGGVLLGAVGEVAVQLGKQAIAIGVGMIAIKKAFSNPFSAIAAGVALVAIGSAIKSTANTVGAVGGGGVGGTGSFSGGGSSNFGTTSTSSSNGFNGRVVFEIAGNKLIGVLNNTSLGNLRVGDSDQLITTG